MNQRRGSAFPGATRVVVGKWPWGHFPSKLKSRGLRYLRSLHPNYRMLGNSFPREPFTFHVVHERLVSIERQPSPLNGQNVRQYVEVIADRTLRACTGIELTIVTMVNRLRALPARVRGSNARHPPSLLHLGERSQAHPGVL